MAEVGSEKNIQEQYANWHPEASDVETIEEAELTGLETAIPNVDQALKAESEAILDYVKKSETEQSAEAKDRNSARTFYEKYARILEKGIEQINALFGQGKDSEAEVLGKRLIYEMKTKSIEFLSANADSPFAEYQKEEQAADVEPDKSKKKKLYKLAMEAVDFIPIIGSAKMIGEGLAGRTMSGEKLSRGKRILRTTEGAVFLALDLTGVGIIEAEGMKSGRLITRSAALMRKTGMAREVYTPVYKTGRYLVENPAAAKLADRSFEKIIQARKTHASGFVEKGKESLFDLAQQDEAELAQAA